MTLWLAIDTATDIGSAALGEPGTVLTELTFTDRRHAAALVPSIMEMLKLADHDFADLSGIAISDGPGSFTGLRIGFSTAKGISHGVPLEWRIAPSLMSAAWRARSYGHGPVAAWYDALRGEVFAATYRFEGDAVETLLAPTRGIPNDIIEQAAVTPMVVVGDGAAMHEADVRAWTGRAAVGPPDGGPRAGALIELLAIRGATTCVEDPEGLEPNYGRDSEAQVRWEAEHGRRLPDS